MAIPPKNLSISATEYQSRREKLLGALGGEVGLIFAGSGAPPLLGPWRPHSHFFYITGIPDESGAAVLFNPKAEDPRRRCVLFLRPLDPELDRWDGFRHMIGTDLKTRTGFETVMRTHVMGEVLTAAATRAKKLACLHGFSAPGSEVSPDLKMFRSLSERIPGLHILDRTSLIPAMRAVKSKSELALIEGAITITAAGYRAALPFIHPGSDEKKVQQTLDRTYSELGADGHAFNPIVGAGMHSTYLHYMKNDSPMARGDLLLVDTGACLGGYAADVTRTYPVGGRFSPEQRRVYDTVLRAQEAAIKVAKAGAYMWQLDKAARAVIAKAGFADAFVHNIGHPLGLDVHEVAPSGKLVEGMVVTVEPGIYLPEKKLGVRIEDDILITSRGARVLTSAIPKDPATLEKNLRD